MVEQSLPVDRVMHTNLKQDEACVHSQVACCEEASPHMAVSWLQSALFIIKECLTITAGKEHAIEGKESRED